MVPEGWIHTTFGKHIECLTGFAFKSDRYSNAEGDIPLLRGDNIEPGNLRWRNAKLWPKNEIDGLDEYHLKDGDFVVALDRTWISSGLKVAEVTTEDLPCLLVQRVARIRAKDSLEQSLLRQYFSGHRFEQYVKTVQTATVVPHISPNDIKEFTVQLPPPSEQKKIAQILSTWDQAITATERLLENNQQRKKGLMQQLLTGKKRLPGFNGEWSQHTLTEVANIIVSPVDKKSKAGEQSVFLCNYTDIYYNTRIVREMPFMKATAKETEIQKYSLKKGDVVITKDSETPGDIAVPALIAEDLGGVVCGYHLTIIRANPKRLNGSFLNYLLSMPRTRYYFFSLATGATRFGLSVGAIHNAALTLPAAPEQEAIANILTICDDEIDTVEKRLTCLKQEKKALMQQLLTGKRRVKVDAEAA